VPLTRTCDRRLRGRPVRADCVHHHATTLFNGFFSPPGLGGDADALGGKVRGTSEQEAADRRNAVAIILEADGPQGLEITRRRASGREDLQGAA
jgi:hypothetical protein